MEVNKYKVHRAPKIQLTISLKTKTLITISNSSLAFLTLTILTKSSLTMRSFLLPNKKGAEKKIFCQTDSLLAMRNKRASIKSIDKKYRRLRLSKSEEQIHLLKQLGMNRSYTKENHAMMLKRSK